MGQPDTPIEDAVQKMLNNNIRRLIILEDENLVLGFITQTNLAEFLRSKLLINGTARKYRIRIQITRHQKHQL